MRVPKAKRLPSGAYRCQVLVNGERISITRDTASEAEKEALRLKLTTEDGRKSPLLTLGAAVDNYINDRCNTLSKSTVMGYRCIRRSRFTKYYDTKMSMINQRMCQRMVNDEVGKCSAKTLKNAWGLISAAIKAETGKEYDVRLPQIIEEEQSWLDEDQIKILLSACRGQGDVELAIIFGLHGITRSEMLGITFDDVALDKGIIHIRGAVVPDEHYQLVYQEANKTQSRRRDIPILIPQLYDAMTDLKGQGAVFTRTPKQILAGIKRLCRENSLPDIGYHSLRRSFASLCWLRGIDLKVLRELGGWSNDQTPMRIYTKISQKHREDEISKLSSFFE